jgi:hypothetical protein
VAGFAALEDHTLRIKIPLIGVTLHFGSKDGGPESHVYMYGIECKRLASALVLRFEDGSREAYHSHAFNAISTVLKGWLSEHFVGGAVCVHEVGDLVYTSRACTHMVHSSGRTWVLSFRGPWRDTWVDIDVATMRSTTLTHGRQEVQ